MVTNLTKEITDFKNDNALLKQKIKNLHGLTEASPRPTSQYITGEQRTQPAKMSHKEAAGVQRVPSAALPAETLPAISVPPGMALSYSDFAAAVIPPSGPTALSDADGFKTVTYRKKTATNTPPTEISAVNKVKPRRQPLIGVSSSLSLAVISKPEKSKALRILVGKPEGKRPLGRPRRRWVDNIKIDLREIG
jgi:hypothetical protein